MKNQAVNPFLPSYEYIPDGEPHVFGDRVYVYGSHDKFNAPIFCMNDYVCYSAPVDDLSDWKYEGVIYRKNQDPKNKLGLHLLFAPDVTKGPDGKFYLYYAFDFMGIMGVAVCDTPAGSYEFHGHVKFPDGKLWGRRKGDQLPFDPGVLTDDDGRVYLYSGFYTPVPAVASGFKKLKNDGGVGMELESDMVTIKEGPKLLFPKQGEGAFKGHEFFEASSMRKKDGQYIFVYSSVHNHELCYAVSDEPLGKYEFGGTLVSQGDLYLTKNGSVAESAQMTKVSDPRDAQIANSEKVIMDEAHALNYLGNTHGGIEEINGQWYVFYHRQTNRHSYSRQACAEKLELDTYGNFMQAEVTSCGLNDGPLKGIGKYEARIACNLFSKDGTGRYDGKNPRKELQAHPYFTQTGKDREDHPDQYIANMRDGAVAGFKYFNMESTQKIAVTVSGDATGKVVVATDIQFKDVIAEFPLKQSAEKETVEASCKKELISKSALYFKFMGKGVLNFHEFELKS